MNQVTEPRPTIVVRAGNPAVPFVFALLLGAGAFVGGMFYEREKHADYRVRVDGVPSNIHVDGVRDIGVSGSVSGIPQEITFKGTALEGILPKEIGVHTSAIVQAGDGYIVVTPKGEIYSLKKTGDPGPGWVAWLLKPLTYR